MSGAYPKYPDPLKGGLYTEAVNVGSAGHGMLMAFLVIVNTVQHALSHTPRLLVNLRQPRKCFVAHCGQRSQRVPDHNKGNHGERTTRIRSYSTLEHTWYCTRIR